MRREREIKNGDSVCTVATKIRKSEKAMLLVIAKTLGLTFYQLLQGLILSVIRLCANEGAASYEHKAMIEAFSDVAFSLKGSFSPISIDGREKRHIKNAILFVEQTPDLRPQILSARMDEYGKIWETYNYDTMLSDFLMAINPELVTILQQKKKELGYFSITHTLFEIIHQSVNPSDVIKAEIDELLSDVRIASGQKINDDVYYKGHRRQNVKEYTTITPNQTFRADL